MVKLPTNLNRHVVGVTAIMAAMAVLGYTTSTATSRRVATLSEEGPAIAQQTPLEAVPPDETFSARALLKGIPPNAYGSARASEGSLGQRKTNGIKAILPSTSPASPTNTKDWNREDWRIAERAVTDHRASAKNRENNQTNLANIIWQPPEEIANRQADRSGEKVAR